jgi:hypothetical protein
MPEDHLTDWTIRDEATLREMIGRAEGLAAKKSLRRLDRYCRQFIGLSPFPVIGTQSADGRADVSPRGDPAGFVQVLDDQRIAIPERPGNKRLDTLSNILENPAVGLLFMIPGFEETLRINGRATLSRDPHLLERMTIHNRPPKVAILVRVEEAFLHCAKAFKRSNLWDPAARADRKVMPSLGRMILEQVAEAERDSRPDESKVEQIDQAIEESYHTRLY